MKTGLSETQNFTNQLLRQLLLYFESASGLFIKQRKLLSAKGLTREIAEILLWTMQYILIWNKKKNHFNGRNTVTHSSSVCDLHGHFILTLWLMLQLCAGGSMDKEHKPVKGYIQKEQNTEFACGCITPRPWGDTDAHLGSFHRLPPRYPHSPLTLLPIFWWCRAKGNLLEGTPASWALLLMRSVSPIPHYYCYQCCRLYYIKAFSWQDQQHTVHGKVHARTKCREECVLLSIQQ